MSTCHSFAHSWHVAQDLLQACLVEPQNVEYRKALADVNERIKIRNQVCEGEPARPLLSFHITTRIRIVTYAAHRRDLLAANLGIFAACAPSAGCSRDEGLAAADEH